MRPSREKNTSWMGRGTFSETQGNLFPNKITCRLILVQLALISASAFAFVVPTTRKTSAPSQHAESDIDPREIDQILLELSGMASRWGLFRRFVYDRLKVRFTPNNRMQVNECSVG